MLNYLIVFLTVIAINIVPFLMPPTWLVLAFFYNNFVFDALLLAVIGAIASTCGRFILSYFGTFFRRFISKERKKDMDIVGRVAKQNPAKSFFVTLAYSLSPFPSNVYFLTVGLAKARAVPVFAGFFIGRLVSYYALIETSTIFFRSLDRLFSSKLLQIAVIDIAAVIFMLLFIMIDWSTMIEKRKLRFVPLKLSWRM